MSGSGGPGRSVGSAGRGVDRAGDAGDAGGEGGPVTGDEGRDADLAARIDGLAALFERRILDDRDKRRLLDEARDGPYRQYLHPLVHRIALLIDRLDREADTADAVEPPDTSGRPGVAGADVDGPGASPPSAAPEADASGPSDGAAELARSVRDELLDALAAHGVREIRTTGPFDPARQEAVSVDRDGNAEPGAVTGVVRRGFAHGDWVFRPARVRVAAPERRR
ncbi:nucleotide exchange factor GrpE [Streptomyces spiramenti]|uniref:Nucleotide exchange factor GrpE n=1 Tax=Streptomyces spiramenti TaxID=2720606 RepID=A0ABX1ATM1_9ACTN|nr:nucleotide exchange factor GrpE [Streptomyces spiramenti]NJP69154.1 nucleotide exchange factor GrpE [Streptomyces spiramenti]